MLQLSIIKHNKILFQILLLQPVECLPALLETLMFLTVALHNYLDNYFKP